jgi:2,3-bisphosphoglycerate-independent phosphoglycerate mutase
MIDRKDITEKMSADQQARLVDQMTARMKEMLSGFPPELQGAMLADLIAIWLVGHAPQIRQYLYREHAKMIWPLVNANEKIIFKGKGHPAGR